MPSDGSSTANGTHPDFARDTPASTPPTPSRPDSARAGSSARTGEPGTSAMTASATDAHSAATNTNVAVARSHFR